MTQHWTRFSVRLLICALALSAQHVLSQTERGPIDQRFSVLDPKTSTALVARVGDLSITAQQFLLSYEFGPSFTKRQKNSKERYLQFMIYEKLLAVEGYAKGYQHSPSVVQTLADIEGDLATEELYKDDVLSRIRVTAKEMNEGMRKAQRHMTLRWLYAPSKEQAAALAAACARGASFDSLFRAQLIDSVKADDRSLETTLFKLEDQNPAMARVADTLRPHVPSAPIEGPDGWYILSITDGWVNLMPTESELNALHYDVKRALTQRKADVKSDDYVKALMSANAPVIVPRTFDLLCANLGLKWLTPEQNAALQLDQHFSSVPNLVDIRKIDQYGDWTLVKMKRGTISLAEFIAWYRAREMNIRLQRTSPRAFLFSTQEMIWRMVRDKLLVDRALKRGLQNREAVRVQKKWWEEKLMYEMEKTALADSVDRSDAALRRYYEAHPQAFRNQEGTPRSFTDARDDVEKEYYSAELTKRLLHRILALKNTVPVDIRKDVLQRIPVDIEDQPRTIDIYAVKKGGTFPRPAFPTIDYNWQAWN